MLLLSPPYYIPPWKFQVLEGLKFQNKQTQKQMIQTKVKVKKPPRKSTATGFLLNERMSNGNSNVQFSMAIEQLIFFFVLITLK